MKSVKVTYSIQKFVDGKWIRCDENFVVEQVDDDVAAKLQTASDPNKIILDDHLWPGANTRYFWTKLQVLLEMIEDMKKQIYIQNSIKKVEIIDSITKTN